jgi:four helix bundle protein
MKAERARDLKERTKAFALRVIRLYSALPGSTGAQVIGKQLLRSGISIGAHYREASRARSDAEFISKIGVALQELDETGYWLELLADGGIIEADKLAALIQETDELIAIFTAISLKVKGKGEGKLVREESPSWPEGRYPTILAEVDEHQLPAGDPGRSEHSKDQ